MCSLTVADQRGHDSGEFPRYFPDGQSPKPPYGSGKDPVVQQPSAAERQESSDAEMVSALRRVVSSQRFGGGNWEAAAAAGSSDYGIYSYPLAYSSSASVGGYGSVSFTGQKRVREEERSSVVTGNDFNHFEKKKSNILISNSGFLCLKLQKIAPPWCHQRRRPHRHRQFRQPKLRQMSRGRNTEV